MTHQLAPHADIGEACTYDRNGHTSQIDYILTRDPNLQVSASPLSDHALNVSPHLPVRCRIRLAIPKAVPKQPPECVAIPRPRWDKCDRAEYQMELAARLPPPLPNNSPMAIDHQIQLLSTALNEAAVVAAPPRKKKLRP